MIAADTSAVVPALSSWHEHHEQARLVLARRPRLVAHVAVETYAVLTRLPGGRRLVPAVAQALLEENFREPLLGLSPEAHRELLASLGRSGVRGGATYDALVGATAARAGATLVTLDQRALGTYRWVGATIEVVG